MRFAGPLTVRGLVRRSGLQVLGTWLMVVVEVGLIALIPLFLGRAIDKLLDDAHHAALLELGVLFFVLIVVAVLRRIYDTRIYGTMRVKLGVELAERSRGKPLSQTNARVTMSREIVDFLEDHTPRLITNVIGVLLSVLILFSFDLWLGVFSIAAVVTMLVTYLLFHRYFYRLNTTLNGALEGQVDALKTRQTQAIATLLARVRGSEVRLSDANAALYGLVFIGMFGLILANLWIASNLPAITVGAIFAILSYSWEVVESSTELPDTLQQWTRLTEIQGRINLD